jgi:hypothetical protein
MHHYFPKPEINESAHWEQASGVIAGGVPRLGMPSG